MDKVYKNRSLIYTILVGLLFATYALSLAANSISMGLIIIFFFIDSKTNIKLKVRKALKNRFVQLSIAYFFVQLIGLVYSDNIQNGIKQANPALPFIILPIIAFSEKIKEEHLSKLKNFIKYWAVALMLFFIFYHLFVVKSTLPTIVDFTINVISSTSQLFPSGLILIALVITLLQIIEQKKRLINICIFLFLVYSLLLLSSRIAIITLVITVVLILYKSFNNISIFKRLSLIAGSLIMLSIAIYNVPRIQRKVDVFYKTTDLNMEVILTKNSITRTKNTVEHRVLIYYVAVKNIMQTLPFGNGTGDFQDVLKKGYKDIGFKAGIEQNFNTHNQYLEEFLKTGILGGIILILLTINTFKITYGSNYLLTSMFVFVFLGCLFDSFLSRQHGILYLDFIIPLFYFNSRKTINDT